MPYASLSACPQTGLVGQSVARPSLSWSWTAATSLILVRLSESAVSLRTTKAFWSCAGVNASTVIPPPLSLRIVCKADLFAAGSPVGFVAS